MLLLHFTHWDQKPAAGPPSANCSTKGQLLYKFVRGFREAVPTAHKAAGRPSLGNSAPCV